MSFKSLLKLACVLGLSYFTQAAIEVEVTNEIPGFTGVASANRVLQETSTTCKFFLLNNEMMNNPEDKNFQAVALNVNGPPYEGSVDSLNFQEEGISYLHDLVRIVYDGAKCDCTVTVHQGLNGEGKSKNYYASGDIGRIILDKCWADKAESLSITCDV